jgi:hypothetical protein
MAGHDYWIVSLTALMDFRANADAYDSPLQNVVLLIAIGQVTTSTSTPTSLSMHIPSSSQWPQLYPFLAAGQQDIA